MHILKKLVNIFQPFFYLFAFQAPISWGLALQTAIVLLLLSQYPLWRLCQLLSQICHLGRIVEASKIK
jgi:hypothetical protein